MLSFQTVEKTILRGKWRRKFGREYFILKRGLSWILNGGKYASVKESIDLPFSVKQHQSFLLRNLKDVDMYLQHNKVKNLQLAIATINQGVIQPGETFSIWKMVGRPSAAKGYLPGLALHNGQISTDIGGGLCQLGNLLYWMETHHRFTIRASH